MGASLLAFLIFVFLLPCFSIPCPTTLPCNHSIQIKPPFYSQPDNETIDLNCQGHLRIGCDNTNKPYLKIYSEFFRLENISYETNIITVQDPHFDSSLKESGCGNLYFNFSTPVNGFFHKIYDPLNTSLSSLRCQPPDQIQAPPDIFGKDYTISYSSSADEYSRPRLKCSLIPDDSGPTFELMFLFHNNSPDLSLQSASYSYDIVARPGCYANSKEVLCEECKEHTQKGIIIGSVVGSAFLISFCCLLLLLYKRRKLRLASSSSNLLAQRQCSDQYFHDVEMAGSGYYTQIFSYKELEEATEGFSASKELGDGGFGIVYKGKLKDGRTVAVKRLYKDNYKSAEQFVNEVEIFSHLYHPNLVTLYGRCNARTSGELLLVYEFVSNGTVADHLHGPRSSENVLTWPVRLSIAIETANALAYLHAVEPPIIHRDVKTNNILLDDDFHAKVADFGLSRLFPLDVTHVSTVPQGTPGYVDPVYHQCYHLTDKSDVYSFGVVLVELISSRPAVDLKRSKEEINLANLALNKIQSSQLDDFVDPALGFRSYWEVRCMISLVAELAFRCLQFDRESRPSIKEVLEALKGIENGNYSREKLLKENMTKEETYLLKSDVQLSPDNSTDNWTSSSVTPDTSG